MGQLITYHFHNFSDSLLVHLQPVNDIDFHPQNTVMITGAKDHTIKYVNIFHYVMDLFTPFMYDPKSLLVYNFVMLLLDIHMEP